jgi:transposase-like protein
MPVNYTAELKAKIAIEALSKTNDLVSEMAKKYDISTSELTSWISELQENAHSLFSDQKESDISSEVFDVSIESDNDTFVAAVNYGAEEEGLDIASITKWSVLGIAAVIVFIVALIPFSQFAFNSALDDANLNSTYYDIEKLNEDANATLNSYGVVDGESGIYRIPIDEAINKMVSD